MRHSSSTVVLIFARTSHLESAVKSFSSNRLQNERISSLLLRQAHHCCEQSGLDWFLISSREQTGSSFSSRLRDAFEQIFKKGYELVIAIGSDTPSLNPADIIKANELLAKAELVLGPSSDGGVYLLAMRQSQFLKIDFDAIDWKTRHVLNQLSELNPHAEVLAYKTDADDFQSLLTSVSESTTSFAKAYQHIVENFKQNLTQLKILVQRFSQSDFLRGPPARLFLYFPSKPYLSALYPANFSHL